MINVIIPIVDDVGKYVEFIKSVKVKNIKFFVGIKENLFKDFSLKGKNIEIYKFANKSKKEEIINALHSCKMEKGKILIARRPLGLEEFQKLTASNKDIAVLNEKQKRFKAAFINFVKKIVNKVFAFSYFDDISAVCFNESMFELLSVCNNLSKMSRINKFVGIEIEYIETIQKKVRKEFSFAKAFLKFLLWTLLFLGSIAGAICLCLFTPLKVLVVIVAICWVFLALIVWLVSVLNFMRTLAVGNLYFGRAEEK